jgi:DDE superfamily endonuclease
MKRKIITRRTIGRKQMTIEELEQWQEEFEQFHARFADLFERSESREQARKYLRGLLAQADRKNGWQVAEVVGDPIPDRMQRLLYRVPWDAEAARDRLQQFVIETFGDEEGIGVVDETSFLKKGTHSVGVARQYLGAAGKLENGQVATVLSYAAKGAHLFLDRRLYLPEEWAWDRQRRAQARVPEEVRFETKPEQAIAMLVHAWERGVPMRLSSRAMKSMVTRLVCGKRSRRMAASTCWQSQPTPACGPSGPRWRSRLSRREAGQGARRGWLQTLPKPGWSPR